MPAPIFYQKDRALAQGIIGAGSALGNVLQYNNQMSNQMNMMDANRQRQANTLNAVLEWQQGIEPGTELQNLGALQQALQGAEYDPSMVQPILQNLIQQSSANRMKTPPQTPFQKKMDEKRVDFMSETLFNAPHVADSRRSLERLKELSQGLKGIEGYAKAAYGSEDATEFNTLGLAAIEPVIKVFNPRGSIPQAKIEMIKKEFAPRASDNRWTIEGKLKGLENFTKNAEKLQETMKGLYELYGENIPMEAILNYEKMASGLLDRSLSEKGVADVNNDGVPDRQVFDKPSADMARQNKGKILINQKTGEKLISNGTRWVKYKG